MARRVESARLIGRGSQVATLRQTLAAAVAGEARIVLISGDAGIGKTRLVREAVAGAREAGTLTATGGCVQLGEVSIAFAPIVEALRELREQLGDAAFDELLGPGRAPIRGLLTGDADPDAVPGALLEHVLGFLTRVGATRPLLVVLEDLHWADASTRDLVTYLGRHLRSGAVTLLLTLRADELHRRHPMRPVLAGLEREQRIERLHLEGLDRADLVRLLPEIGIDDPADALVDDLLARTGGNPFYVEELVAAGRLGGGLPDTLAEVILARVDNLPEEVRRLLRAAAVVDDSVDDAVLAAVVEQPVTDVTAGLRRAVEEQVLVLDAGTCRFRHALVREALYDDLLPGERTRLHLATAAVLEHAEHLPPQTRWALVAYHWDAGRNAARAYTASVRAGQEAEKVHAYADAAEQYDRALSLRDQVAASGTDPEALAGLTLADLLVRASDVVQASSRSSRALVLAEAALSELGPAAPPERRARILERVGLINWKLHHGGPAVAAYEKAVALVADRPASRDKALVLAALGRSLMVRALYRQAEPVIRQAIAVAQEVGAPDVEGHARCSLAPCLHGIGQVVAATAELERAMQLCRAGGRADDVCRVWTNMSHGAYQSSRYADVDLILREGLDYVVATGRAHHHGEAIAGNVIAALHAQGRWAEAQAVHDDPRIPTGDPYQELRWLPVLLDSGRLDEARAAVQTALEGTVDADDVQFGALSLLSAARLRILDAEWDDARRLVADALPLIERSDEHFYLSKAYRLGIAVEAERVAASGPDPKAVAVADDLLARLRGARQALLDCGVVLLPEPALEFRTAEAEGARVRQEDDPADWAGLVEAWERLGQPVRAAAARLRQADALVRRTGDRAEVAELLRAARAAAEPAGARPLVREIDQLARRVRLELDPGARRPLDVTPRELDVLRLLAQGRTNRQIGATLFISEKTASVHVTNLLRKLGVGSRVEAAALAQRAGVLDA